MELVTILIAAGGMKLDSRSYMGTPLACAVNSGSYDCFKTLIQVPICTLFLCKNLDAYTFESYAPLYQNGFFLTLSHLF